MLECCRICRRHTPKEDKLSQLPSPRAQIGAIHSCSTAASAKSNDAGGLEPTVHLAEGAKVMLTSNLWQQTGLCNGAVDAILYAEGHRPPHLPIAVIVNFKDYAGPPFLAEPKCIPIPPRVFEWNNGSQRLSRQQLPLQLSYAITIKDKHWRRLCVGNKERAAGTTFVAISRLRSLTDGLFEPMPFKQLESNKDGRRRQAKNIGIIT